VFGGFAPRHSLGEVEPTRVAGIQSSLGQVRRTTGTRCHDRRASSSGDRTATSPSSTAFSVLSAAIAAASSRKRCVWSTALREISGRGGRRPSLRRSSRPGETAAGTVSAPSELPGMGRQALEIIIRAQSTTSDLSADWPSGARPLVLYAPGAVGPMVSVRTSRSSRQKLPPAFSRTNGVAVCRARYVSGLCVGCDAAFGARTEQLVGWCAWAPKWVPGWRVRGDLDR